MIIVNIEKYGDWDTPYTVLSMAAPEGATKKVIGELKKEAEELFTDTDDTDDSVKYLKDWGFTTVKALSVTIGGNL